MLRRSGIEAKRTIYFHPIVTLTWLIRRLCWDTYLPRLGQLPVAKIINILIAVSSRPRIPQPPNTAEHRSGQHELHPMILEIRTIFVLTLSVIVMLIVLLFRTVELAIIYDMSLHGTVQRADFNSCVSSYRFQANCLFEGSVYLWVWYEGQKTSGKYYFLNQLDFSSYRRDGGNAYSLAVLNDQWGLGLGLGVFSMIGKLFCPH